MKEIQKQLIQVAAEQGCRPDQLDAAGVRVALARVVMARAGRTWRRCIEQGAAVRRAYYLSAEYLMGEMTDNNLHCLGLEAKARQALVSLGLSPSLLEQMPDMGLGNGGLGRLAACFLDAAATRGIPLDGYGIRYRYGIFRQRLEGGTQQEEPDDWTKDDDPWSVRRDRDAVTVTMGEDTVRAVPYDTPIIGWGGRQVATLRLWQCEPTSPFDLALFNDQQYDRAVRERNRAEDISRVLYPNDTTPQGKLLRLRQQYFFCSASMQDMLRAFEAAHGPAWERLPEYVSLQLNDTHPVIAVPELVRLLMERGVPFEVALDLVTGVFNYTNHTIMQEALERWDIGLIRRVCPPVARLIRRMATRQRAELQGRGLSPAQQESLLLLQGRTVHMAYLACRYSGHINGVAELHTHLLRTRVLAAWQEQYPDKIVNVTNGITPRRWLTVANPPLTALLEELAGDRRFLTRLERLQSLDGYADSPEVLARFRQIKQQNKRHLAEYMRHRDGLVLDPDTLLDVQIKRLHEYKRQLLNILCVLEMALSIRDGASLSWPPVTVLFGGKAAPGYRRAKGIIQLIHAVGAFIAADPVISARLKVLFVPNYDVSYAQRIVAAADVSEQISTAGTEASGTGNMKLMLSGAVTLGTYDGANVEIVRQAGEENNYIFGARVEELETLRRDYRPRDLYEQDARLHRCLDALVDGTLDDGGTGVFRELYHALLDGTDWHAADHYFVLRDFDDYLRTRCRVYEDYRQSPDGFAAKGWHNLCAAGRFSADRSVEEYARTIWKLKK